MQAVGELTPGDNMIAIPGLSDEYKIWTRNGKLLVNQGLSVGAPESVIACTQCPCNCIDAWILTLYIKFIIEGVYPINQTLRTIVPTTIQDGCFTVNFPSVSTALKTVDVLNISQASGLTARTDFNIKIKHGWPHVDPYLPVYYSYSTPFNVDYRDTPLPEGIHWNGKKIEDFDSPIYWFFEKIELVIQGDLSTITDLSKPDQMSISEVRWPLPLSNFHDIVQPPVTDPAHISVNIRPEYSS